jgi:hypothetical protein
MDRRLLQGVAKKPDRGSFEPMYEALRRRRVSPDLAANLEGLLTEAEIRATMPMLAAWVSRQQLSRKASKLTVPADLLHPMMYNRVGSGWP